jgi:DNA polymerase III subunit gamma/tau
MSLDTKYRPVTFDDVLGQEGTVQILKQYVKTGAGFHQSYLFAGPWGSGKTTLARIHARALLCSNPVEGSPCDRCNSCKSILLGGSSENFFEIDAATNSGKDSIKRITEDLQYSTFSGRRRIYLMDEAHRLSSDALDALLKPLEDCVPDGEDKLLVCLFCTTEPEKMRTTILSRCAPAFVIRPVSPVQIGQRLAYVCDRESIPYETEALVLIAELTECHIRDALKAVEGVSMLGSVNMANVSKYLHLDYATTVLEILSNIKGNLPRALSLTENLLKTMSPITIYEKLADMSMLAYVAHLGAASVPSYLSSASVSKVGSDVGMDLLTFAEKFSSRPGRPTPAMVLCDIAQLHRGPLVQMVVPQTPPPEKKLPEGTKNPGKVDDKPQMVDNVFVHPRAVNSRNVASSAQTKPEPPPPQKIQPQEFFRLVTIRVSELKTEREDRVGQERRDDVGRPGANQSGGDQGNGGDPGKSPQE